jgi:hypothetical protein
MHDCVTHVVGAAVLGLTWCICTAAAAAADGGGGVTAAAGAAAAAMVA